jgi:hypothetical protein
LFGNQEQQRKSVGQAERFGQMSRRRLSGKKVPALDRALKVRMRRSFSWHEHVRTARPDHCPAELQP